MNEYQIFVIGFVASVIVWIIRQLAARGKTVPPAVLTIGVYVVSLVLAVWWMGVQLPPFPPFDGPVAFASALLIFLNDLLAVIGGYVAFATLIYQAFVKALLERGVPMVLRRVKYALARARVR